jgi:DNA-binding phage protein
MKIRKVEVNNHKKCFEIETAKGRYTLPFSKARPAPSAEDTVEKVYVDKELGGEAITYELRSGKEGSIPLDGFLDYNRDPEYVRKILLYNLTVRALELIEQSKLGKRELARKLGTSPAQLYRLLDTTNHSKSVDNMVRLIAAMGFEVDFTLVKPKAA